MSEDPFQRAQAYNTAVVGVGFAGVFALLSYTHEALSAGERKLAAVCLLFSLAVFMVWVIGTMILATLRASGKPPGQALRERPIWVVVLVLTIAPACVAAAAMFHAYWRIVVWPG